MIHPAALRMPILALALMLAGCASAPVPEMPAAADAAKPADAKSADASPSAKPENDDPGPPLEKHEAAAQCWMKLDRAGGSLDARAKLVDKCIDDKMKGVKDDTSKKRTKR